MLPIDRHLRVVARLESSLLVFMIWLLGIGEIALRIRLGLAVGAFAGPPATGIAVLPRRAPALIVACALRRLQTRFGGLDRRQALLPALQLLGQLVAPKRLAPTLVFLRVHRPRLRQQRLDLRLQTNLLLAHHSDRGHASDIQAAVSSAPIHNRRPNSIGPMASFG